MLWYYAEKGRQAGPVSRKELQRLAREGAIRPDTLVWHEGMPEWQPYAEMAGPAAGEAACSECGEFFSPSDMVPCGEAWVCSGCKPVFLQKVSEGIAEPGLVYAGFWPRFLAVFIDGVILQVFLGILNFAALRITRPETRDFSPVFLGVNIVLSLFGHLLSAAYEIFFLGRFAATPGKMILGLKVVQSDGSRIGYGRAVGRHFAKYISAFILMIGYLMAAFDKERRALHDHICDTRVVRK